MPSFKIYLLFLASLLLIQCQIFDRSPPISVKFLYAQSFKEGYIFKQLELGGLSSLDFDKDSQTIFALSDDKKNHRIYLFDLIKNKNTYSLKLKNDLRFFAQGKTYLPFNMDPEALALTKNGNIYIASEGQQIFKTPEPPKVFQFNSKAEFITSWQTDSVFWNPQKMSSFGTQENNGFESLAQDKISQIFWLATETPLRQDLKNPLGKLLLRINQLQIKDGKMIEQYPYLLADKSKGLTEMIFLKNKKLLTLERSYDSNKNSNDVLLFFTDCEGASSSLSYKDLSSQKIIKNYFRKLKTNHLKSCSKQLLWSLKKQKSVQNGNLEGMVLGPKLAPNKQLLIMVNDNNFIEGRQTQFLFFELQYPKNF